MPKKRPTKKRNPFDAMLRQMSAAELCKSLVALAAFHVEDKVAQRKIYEAVRRLQLLEKAARAAGLVAADT
jgi:hypothetical protein